MYEQVKISSVSYKYSNENKKYFEPVHNQGRLVMKAAKAAAYPVFLADFLFYFYLKIFEICIKFHWLSLVLSAMTNPPPKKKKFFFLFFFGDFFANIFYF